MYGYGKASATKRNNDDIDDDEENFNNEILNNNKKMHLGDNGMELGDENDKEINIG
jgi:hypothetical protein